MMSGPPTPLKSSQECEVQKEKRTFPGHLGCHKSLPVSRGRDGKKEHLPICLAQLWMGGGALPVLKTWGRAPGSTLELPDCTDFIRAIPVPWWPHRNQKFFCPLTRSPSLAGPARAAGNKQMEVIRRWRFHCPSNERAPRGVGGGT